jgi:hypothetical protein
MVGQQISSKLLRRLEMKKVLIVFALCLLLIGAGIGGTLAMAEPKADGNVSPEGALTVAELLENPVYDNDVSIQGTVSLLGELFCPCFVLTSGGQKVHVWYDFMVEDGAAWSPVSMDGIKNGDWVMVTGILKQAGQHVLLNDFWAKAIEKAEPLQEEIIGGTPGSCGYVWDGERGGWHRPWDPDSFISAEDKPEWQTFIPVVEDSQNDVFIGGTPESCGYVWDEELDGWHRPWDSDSFIPADEKPEWEKYIP